MVVTNPVTFAVPEDDALIDADKVATLKAAIASGAYRIDHEELASAIISFGNAAGCQKFDVAAPSEN